MKPFPIWCDMCAKQNECHIADTVPKCYEPKQTEPSICDNCRYYNSIISCGSTPSACEEADKFAKEFVDGLKKLKPQTEPMPKSTDCSWK